MKGFRQFNRFLGLYLFALVSISDVVAGEIAYLAVDEGFWQVWVMNEDGTDPRQVSTTAYDKTMISWFPDRKTLLVNGNDGLVRTINIESGHETVVPAALEGMLDATLAPSGELMSFSLNTSGSVADSNIWILDVDGENPRKVTQMPRMQRQPVWSLDSASVYFISGGEGLIHDFWALDLTTQSTRQLTIDSIYQFDLALGPRGLAAFSSIESDNYDIWVAPLDDLANARRVTTHAALDSRPSWGPEGQRLAFESYRGGTLNIWVLNLVTGDVERLTDHPTGARLPVWAPGPLEDDAS